MFLAKIKKRPLFINRHFLARGHRNLGEARWFALAQSLSASLRLEGSLAKNTLFPFDAESFLNRKPVRVSATGATPGKIKAPTDSSDCDLSIWDKSSPARLGAC